MISDQVRRLRDERRIELYNRLNLAEETKENDGTNQQMPAPNRADVNVTARQADEHTCLPRRSTRIATRQATADPGTNSPAVNSLTTQSDSCTIPEISIPGRQQRNAPWA